MKPLLLALLLSASLAHAEPLAQVEREGTRVVLYSEPCALHAVKNLPGRVTWKDASGEFEGCWSLNNVGIASMYFDDLTVMSWPISIFSRVRSI